MASRQKEYTQYRRVIKGIVSTANKEKITINSSIAYNTLVRWLKDQQIRVENEDFKVMLTFCKRAVYDEEFNITGDYELIKGLPTEDDNPLKDYLAEVIPKIRVAVEQHKQAGTYDSRTRSFDVVDLGRLFDRILDYVPEDNRYDVIRVMDDFFDQAVQRRQPRFIDET